MGRWHNPRGTIYYIACPTTNRVKIGFTTGDPEKRLRTLQTGSPTQLTLLGHEPGTLAGEQELHRLFDVHRIQGEWFALAHEIELHFFEVAKRALRRAYVAKEPTPEWAADWIVAAYQSGHV